MNILLIGSGGREHAILKKLAESPLHPEIFAVPGNGGMRGLAKCYDGNPKDIDGIVRFAKTFGIDFAVVAPDDPLVLGAVDALEQAGVRCFGPRANAAILEGSKVFAKQLMEKYGIPTAKYAVFTNMDEALAYLQTAPMPAVIKADGLALGKGVVIAETLEQAQQAVRSMMEERVFGASGSRIVIEEFLQGPEVSVLSFTDGKTIVPMVSSMDHKRAMDGDRGRNTGGMGTVAPNPYYTPQVAQRCMDEIFLPTIRAMAAEGRPFKGCLYFGLMLTADGPKVIEYNCRFGDPETQVVLPLLETDLLEIMQAVADERLGEVDVRFRDAHACCVILASRGYPGSYSVGFPITVDDSFDVELFCAGVKRVGDQLLTGGGRVLGITAVAPTLREAVDKAYENVPRIHFENAYWRKDIGTRALQA